MYSIIIPTMWRFAPFAKFLIDLCEHPLVKDIVLIDNDTPKALLSPSILQSLGKITYLPQEGNIGVNGAWNLGVRHAKTDRLVILNDDLLFDLRLFRKMLPFLTPENGNLFFCPGHDKEFGQPPVTTGEIDIIPWRGHNRFGYGMLMAIHRDNYIPLPKDTEMRLYYGDNLYFELPINKRNRVNYIITNCWHWTPFAATCATIQTSEEADQRMRSEFELYQEYLRGRAQVDVEMLEEYTTAVNTPSDINRHIPILYYYAMKCRSVVELGVRTGVSTRAFLRAATFGVTLRSYDLVLDPTVQELFWRAARHGYPVSLEVADSRTLEIAGGTDMLFIDTWHTADVLQAELNQHHAWVSKYIAFHDTAMSSAGHELMPVIIQFFQAHPEWRIVYHTEDNNGLLVLAKDQ